MATLLRHKESGRVYALIGAGFGVDRDRRGFFDSRPEGHIELKFHDMICCANRKGELGWFKSAEIEVLSIDGVPVGELPLDG